MSLLICRCAPGSEGTCEKCQTLSLREAARWGFALAAVEAAKWSVMQMRSHWTDTTDVAVRQLASKISENLDSISRYIRKQAGL